LAFPEPLGRRANRKISISVIRNDPMPRAFFHHDNFTSSGSNT
jgi:hypothetical protein